MLDIFNNDAFSVISLTDALNDVSFVPGRISSMGLFLDTPITTTTIAIEAKGDSLVLVPPTPRGAPGITVDKGRRNLRPFIIPHFEINDGVMAEEVQGIRAMGTEQAVETVQGILANRFAEHQNSMSATEEYARIGAIKGLVTYADGSTLDLFSEFGVVQETEIDFDLDAASPAGGILRKKCQQLIRTMATNLKGVPFSGVTALCGDAFFDDLIAHVEVRNTFLNTQAASELRQGYVQNGMIWSSFPFGGIVWENYRGSVGATTFIDTNKAHFFPTGAPGVFKTYRAPADYIDTVNTLGQRLYAQQYVMPNNKGVHLDVQMNALSICTRPKALMVGRRT